MTVTIDLFELKVILRVAAELGAKDALVQSGLLSRYLNQNSAYKLYGRRAVDGWIKERKIIAHKSGDNNSKVQLDRLELEALVKGTDLNMYFRKAA
jgi:hypothetical protein